MNLKDVLFCFKGKEIDWNFTFKVTINKIKKTFYLYFKPKTVIRNIMLRENCSKCTKLNYCCKESFEKTPFSCKHLLENGMCAVYHTKDYPISCFISPVDYNKYIIEDCYVFKQLNKKMRESGKNS